MTLEHLQQIAAALVRRGLEGTAVEFPGLVVVPDGKGGVYEVFPAGGHWAAEHYDTLEDVEEGVPGPVLMTAVQAGSEDVERIAAALVQVIQKDRGAL